MKSNEEQFFIPVDENLQQNELVIIAKQELMEQSEKEATIVELGTLASPENKHLWKGAISLKRRIDSGELTEVEVAEATIRINSYYVPVGVGAPKRCVDGSTVLGYDDNDPRWYGRALGPQVQGGTADEALARRLLKGVDENESPTLLDDIEDTVANSNSRFAPGDHTDDHATDENCGCGAIVGMPRKLEQLKDDESCNLAKSKADSILSLVDLEAQPGAFEKIRATGTELLGVTNYLPEKTSEVLNKLLELNPNAVEKLVRPHNEISVTINFVQDTTFHRDHYNAVTDSKIQNFGLDAWNIVEEYGQDGYALVVDAVQTLMDLTDGSLLLFARLPKTEA